MLTRPLPRAAILFSVLLLPSLNATSAYAQPCSESLFPGRLFDVGFQPESVSLGDLDGDGDLDMVVANPLSDEMSVLLNSGDGTFATQIHYAAGSSPHIVSLGDLDGDTDLDMVMMLDGGEDNLDDVSVLLNQYIQLSLCPADMNPDCVLNIFDVFAFLNAFTSGDPAADFTGNGTFDIVDVFAFLNAYNAGCP